VTVEQGTNTILGLDPARIAGIPAALASRDGSRPDPPQGWDGLASERVAEALAERLKRFTTAFNRS
jgi:UDP-N-acetylglucosamine 2-epimerase (non-hydrolysing)